jgi:hypothetical protein
MKSKKLSFRIYLISITVLILVVFNTIFTLQIHKKLTRAVSSPGRWPVGSYVYDKSIGFDFAPNISGPVQDGSFYVKSHQFGYRIGEKEDATSFRPGGLMSLGCSFTYGDEVESEQTFTQRAADSLGLPAYNYGICSFSYTHALLKAQKLKREGVLDKLQPEYVVLGCWSGLPSRSRSPFPPLASDHLPLPAAYMVKKGNELQIRYPMNLEHVFEMVDLYRKEGTGMNGRKFFSLFFAAPKYVYLYLKNNRLVQETKIRDSSQEVSDFEIYDFYFSGIEEVFSTYGTRIIVLFMPNSNHEQPGRALVEAVKLHPGIILVDGMQAVQRHGVQNRDYAIVHPQPPAHLAYAREIVGAARAF